MSIKALQWSLKVTAPSASAKLALICLADRADDDGRCSPTIADLERATQLSERSVRESLTYLRDARLIREDAGTTSSKRVFTLLMPGATGEHEHG